MKTHFYIFIFMLATFRSLNAQVPSYNIQITLSDSSSSAFGFMNIGITYHSSDSSFVPLVAASDTFQIRIAGEEWINVMDVTLTDGTYIYELPDGYTQNDYFSLYLQYLEDYNEYTIQLDSGATIELRKCASVSMGNIESEQKIYSNVITCMLPPMSSIDRNAFEYLISMKSGSPEVKYLTTPKTDLTYLRTIPIYETIISNYPSSVLAQFAKARLAIVKCRMADKDNVPLEIKSQIQQAYDELSVSPFGLVRKLIEKVKVCLEN